MNPNSLFVEVRDPEEECCNWLYNNVDENKNITVNNISEWMQTDERPKPVSHEQAYFRFCPSDLALEMAYFKEKNGLEHVKPPTHVRDKLRRSCNPFELIGYAGFSSRTAVKAANLDWLVKFTEPLDQHGNPLVKNDHEGLCYSDIYGDQKGFVEYIEGRRRNQQKKTTKLDLRSMSQKSGRLFSVTDPRTIDRFIDYVRNSDVGARLHLLAVDAHPESRHNRPVGLSAEIINKHFTLNYCLLALTLIRPNGSFIVKIYKTQELFTVGLLYLMYQCFDKISVVKPNSCRPDNSEGYLVCKWKKHGDQTEIVRQYLHDVHLKLYDLRNTDLDVMQLVPFEVLEADRTFFDYVYRRNVQILRKILQCWQCYKRYSESEVKVHDRRQSDLKKRCISLWDIPEDRNWKLKAPIDNWRRTDGGRCAPVSEVRKIDNWRKRPE